ncbi:McrB family protein [Myceligenerans halotolerans]
MRERIRLTSRAAYVVLDHLFADRRSVIDSSRTIWVADVAERLRSAIEDSLEQGTDPFYVKLQRQLANQDRDVKLLAAELTYLREVPLVPGNMRPETKQEHVEKILSWTPGTPTIPLAMLEGLRSPGAFHGGQGYSQSAWRHVVWLAKVVVCWDQLPDDVRAYATKDPWAFRDVVDQVSGSVPTIRNALLFLAFPEHFERTVNDAQKRAIRERFADRLPSGSQTGSVDLDRDLWEIRKAIEAEQDGKYVNFYDEPFVSAWWQSKHVDDRAWAVRPKPAGKELVDRWLGEGFVSLAATYLGDVEPGSDKTTVRTAIEERYTHVDYAQRVALTEDYFDFLSRMKDQDLVVARHDDVVHVGRVSGLASYASEEPRLRLPVIWESDPIDDGALSEQVRSLLNVPDRSVVDLTAVRDDFEALLPTSKGESTVDLVDDASDVASSVSGTITLRRADEALARATYTDVAWLDEYIGLLESRRQVIVHGPPGTGKTYLARKIARHIAGDEQVPLVQFHPSYAYEDFFEGFRPRAQGDGSLTFDKVPGVLRSIAAAARKDPSSPYVLIIDEINRGNLAKVFGELYFLLEYRDEAVSLQYSPGERFTLPKNLYLIGTMNTADRSIAMVDMAIRRRFAFIEMHPDVQPVAGLLSRWLAANEQHDARAELLVAVNREIGAEDREFKIGPSYLMRDEASTNEGLERIWRHEILPLLEEHYYGRLTREQVVATFGLDVLRRRLVSGASDDGGGAASE